MLKFDFFLRLYYFVVLVIIAESIFLNSSISNNNFSEVSRCSGFNSCNKRNQYLDSLASLRAIFNRKEKSLSPNFSLASI